MKDNKNELNADVESWHAKSIFLYQSPSIKRQVRCAAFGLVSGKHTI